jgi:hypothetical protein
MSMRIRLAEPEIVDLDDVTLHLSMLGDLYDLAVILEKQDANRLSAWVDKAGTDGERPWRNWPDIQVEALHTGESITLFAILAAAAGPFLRLAEGIRDFKGKGRMLNAKADVSEEIARRYLAGGNLTDNERIFLSSVGGAERRTGALFARLPIAEIEGGATA